MKFNENLQNLRKIKQKNVSQVSKETLIPYDNYRRYEKGVCEPSIDVLITLANYYHVTLDYLLRGDSDGFYIRSEEYIKLKNKEKNYDKIVEVLNSK